MDKFLIFDMDNSLSALGNDEQISGYTGGIRPLRITKGIDQVRSYMRLLFDMKEVEVKHELFDETVKMQTYVLSKRCQELGLTGLVFDTLSHLFRQDMRILEQGNKSGALEMQDWGKLERMYNSFIAIVSSLPMWVIVNCHLTYDKDQSTGTFYYSPLVKGSTKDTLQEYFDCVFYTKASRDGKKMYTWQTFADASKFAKDRKGILQPHIVQDFSSVISAYRDAGIPYPKILVIGESGTGKTKALQSVTAKR